MSLLGSEMTSWLGAGAAGAAVWGRDIALCNIKGFFYGLVSPPYVPSCHPCHPTHTTHNLLTLIFFSSLPNLLHAPYSPSSLLPLSFISRLSLFSPPSSFLSFYSPYWSPSFFKCLPILTTLYQTKINFVRLDLGIKGGRLAGSWLLFHGSARL